MPQFADYRISLLGHDTTEVKRLFPGNDFQSIAWQHSLNDPGVFRLELVAETTTKDEFVVDYQVFIERNATGNEEDWKEEFTGFHHDDEEWYESDRVDEHYWASMGQSPEWLIDQPLLQPLMNVGNGNWAFYDMWWQHGFADNVVKLMVAEQMTASPDADRNFTHMIVEGDASAGTVSCFQGSYVRLLDAVRDTIGEDGSRGNCDFAVVKVAGGYEFRTYAPFKGTDRRVGHAEEAGIKPTIFSLDNENMLNPRLQTIRHGEVTVAIGGWQGGGMQRGIYQQENAAALAESPYRRREQFYDLRDLVQPDVIEAYLRQKLNDDGKKEILTFNLIQSNACLYRRDFEMGDLCTAIAFGKTFDVRVTDVVGRLSGDNEEEIDGLAQSWSREAAA
ncbi:MAG TPA: hypothetical protein VM537_01320 [Anaerolineae bacterium]|nr:hypothetical protein [Anaerolineae bacterium]